jgi:hypothetical protein
MSTSVMLPLDYVSLEFILENKFGVMFVPKHFGREECPICSDDMYEKYTARPRCCHTAFHRNCLLMSILTHSYNKCSKCSKKFTPME